MSGRRLKRSAWARRDDAGIHSSRRPLCERSAKESKQEMTGKHSAEFPTVLVGTKPSGLDRACSQAAFDRRQGTSGQNFKAGKLVFLSDCSLLQNVRDGRLSRAKDTPRGMRPRRCSGPCRTMRSGSSLEEQTRKTRPQHEHYESLSSQALVVYPCRRTSCSEDRKSFCPTRVA